MATTGMGIAVVLAALVALSLVLVLATRSLANPGPRLVRFVEIACVVIIVVTVIATGLIIGGSLSGDNTTVTLPVVARTPDVIVPGLVVDKPSATIISGGVDQATLVIRGLSMPTRLLLTTGFALQAATIVLIAWTMRRLARNLLSEQPFTELSRPLFRVAWILFAGSVLSAILSDVGSSLAGQEALRVHGWGTKAGFRWPDLELTAENLAYLGWPEPGPLSITIPWTPLAAALGLALLGLAFRAGERMQADTAGLV